MPGKAHSWSFDIVLMRELGGVGRLGMVCSTHWGGSRAFCRFSVATAFIIAKQGFLSKKTRELSNTEECVGNFLYGNSLFCSSIESGIFFTDFP